MTTLYFSTKIHLKLEHYKTKKGVKLPRYVFKATDHTNARKVSHGDLRGDRPPHGRGGRASKDGLAASRRANAMTHLYIDTCKREDPNN